MREGARLEVPRLLIGPQAELSGEGVVVGDVENQGRISAGALRLEGAYDGTPPITSLPGDTLLPEHP